MALQETFSPKAVETDVQICNRKIAGGEEGQEDDKYCSCIGGYFFAGSYIVPCIFTQILLVHSIHLLDDDFSLFY